MTSDRIASPNQGNSRYGSQHSQNTLSWALSCNDAGCSRTVFYTALKLQGYIIFFEPGNWGLMAQAILFPGANWIFAASDMPEEYSGSLFSTVQQELWSSIMFLKETDCHFLLGSHLKIQFHLIQLRTVMAGKITEPSPLTSLFNMEWYIVSCVYLHSSETAGILFFFFFG